MKIAVIGSKGLPPNQGGIEHHCAEIYPRIVAAGHQVDLYARSSYNHRRMVDNSLKAYKGVRVMTMPSTPLGGVDALVCSGLSAAIATFQQYDIVHFHALGPSLFTPLPKLFSQAKVITTCHGLDWKRAKWGKASSQLIKMGERAAVRFSDQVVVVSEVLQDYFVKTYGKRPTYIENAPVTYADTDGQFAYGQSLGLAPQRYLVLVGRLVPEKRADLLLAAFQRLQTAGLSNGWKLVLVGDKSNTGNFLSQLLRLARNSPNIVLTGELQGQYLAEIVRGAGLFVLPSDLEGLPLALLEAMQEGIPSIVSDIPVHRQIIGHSRGLTFKAGECSALEERLIWAITHPEEMQSMAQQAQRYVRSHYNWNTITQKYLDLYESTPNCKQKQHLQQPEQHSQSSAVTEA